MEMWSDKPDRGYPSLHVVSSIAYYHVTKSKFDPRAKKSIFMRISSCVKGYRLWCPETRKIIFSKDFTFDEYVTLKRVTNGTPKQVEHTTGQVEFESTIIKPVDEDNIIYNSPSIDNESDG